MVTSAPKDGRARPGQIARAALAGIAILSALGLWMLSGLLMDAFQRRSLDEYHSTVRTTQNLLLDLVRIEIALGDLLEARETPAAAQEKVAVAADLMTGRLDSFWRYLAIDPGSEGNRVKARVETALQSVEAYLAGARDAGVPRLRADLAAAISQLAQFTEIRRLTYIDKLKQREAEFRRLTVVTIALFAIFALIAALAVILWWREILARERRREAEEEARFLAYHDPLTRLFNRTRFGIELARVLAVRDAPVLLVLDIDGFKEVNDTLGHAEGDALLVAVAERVGRAAAAAGGVAARLGGDEFGLILPGPYDPASIDALCRSLVAELQAPVPGAGAEMHPSSSIGAAAPSAIAQPRPADPALLMRAADYALYQAKASGKKTFCIYDSDMAEGERAAREIREAMPAALAAGEFCVEYQPQVWLDDGGLYGFEALLRWRRNGVLMPPSQFIGIAEETGFILDLDRHVLRTALAEAARWAAGSGPVTIGVNLSALHFRSFEIVQHVAEALRDSGIAPGHVTLEITESVLIDDWVRTSAILQRIAETGVRIALDDFGTGYSSMSYLRRLAVHEVKIDRSFVQDVETSDQTRMILDGLVDIVRALDMRLVVEGIETAGQARLIRDLGGQIGQGYHFGRSMSANEARALVQTRRALAMPA